MNKIEIELPELPNITDHEFTGEYREPKEGEMYLNILYVNEEKEKSYEVFHFMEGTNPGKQGARLILRKKKWRADNGFAYSSIFVFDGVFCIKRIIEEYSRDDAFRYAEGNYFKSKIDCEKVIDKILKILKARNED